jgi:glycosyltransferase involved in cell wall biosynthesis
MIALGLKKRLNIPWLADFRDPWTSIDFYEELKLSAKANRKHHQQERSVLENADAVSVISQTMATDFERLFKRQYEVISNGFDEEDQIGLSEVKDEKFSIAHIGSMNKARNPIALWKALAELISENKELRNDLEIKLVGPVDFSVKGYIEKYKLTNFISYLDYMPHNEIIKVQKKSRVLLLLINNTPNAKMVVTGKLFEYIASGTPILCVGPEDGDAANILKETKSGLISGFDDVNKLKGNILEYYNMFSNGNLEMKNENASKFSRKNLTKNIADLLNRIVK